MRHAAPGRGPWADILSARFEAGWSVAGRDGATDLAARPLGAPCMAGHEHPDERQHGHHHAHEDHDWEERAQDYNEVVDLLEPELGKASQALLRAARVKPGDHVLDVACGPGHTAAAATAAGAWTTGIDTSPAMIAIASDRFPGTSFQEGDMLAPPAGPWDAIICRLGAHHADPAWLAAAYAVLRPGGRLAIAETDAVDAEARANDMRSPADWSRLLEEAGFENIEVAASEANLSTLPPDVLAAVTDRMGGDGPPKGAIYIIAGDRGTPS